jgi:signal transduction histidine kinase
MTALDDFVDGLRGGRGRGAGRWVPLIVVALIGAFAAVFAFRVAADADDTRVQGAMEVRAEWRARDFERKLGILADPVEAMAILLTSVAKVSPELFHRFAAGSHTQTDPLRRLAWAPRAVRQEPTAGTDPDSFPVEVEHSFTETRALENVDLAAEPARRSIIERARDEARPVSTPTLQLFKSSAIGYVVFWPIYQDGVAPATVEERRARLRGVVEGTVELADALNAAIEGTPPIIETIYFFTGERSKSTVPDATYSSAGSVTQGGEMPSAPAAGALRISRSIDVFGQQWMLVFDFAPSALAPLRSSGTWAFPSEQLVQSQKLEAIGNLTGGMAHDFNNLLGVIIGNLDLLRDRQSGDPEADELSRDALDAALRGADLTRRLLAFARRQPLAPARTDVNELIAGIVKLLERTLGEEIQITLDLSPDTWPVVVDPAQLESSLANLATNARDAMPGGGQLMILTGNRFLDADYAFQHAEVQPGDYAMIEISDTGTGMDPEVASHIFEPFYTTKEQGKGTGLGLSMVFGFIKQSGGHINVYSEVGIGTTFRLYLRRAEIEAEAASIAAPTALVRGAGETILAVEDNASLRRVVVRQLTELGYRVIEAEDAQAALRVLESETVDLLFTDVVMPGGTSGYEIARTALTRWPAIKIVLTSGFPEYKLNGNGAAANLRLLSKPYRRDDLSRVVREVLDS